MKYETATLTKETIVPNDKIFVLLGKAASGKTECSKDIVKFLDIKEIVSCTSRPARPGEINGVHYHFINYLDFNIKDFIEIKEFNNWRYGTKRESVKPGQNYIVVLEPEGYRNFKKEFGDRVVGIYIMAPWYERFTRYISRDGNIFEAVRRFRADDKDFEEFEYEVEHVVINNKQYSNLLNKVSDIIMKELYNE